MQACPKIGHSNNRQAIDKQDPAGKQYQTIDRQWQIASKQWTNKSKQKANNRLFGSLEWSYLGKSI